MKFAELVITLQKLDDTILLGDPDLSYPNIRNMISQVFRQVRIEKKGKTKPSTERYVSYYYVNI